MEKILEINETEFLHAKNTYSGFVIKTDRQEIKLGIDNDQLCCENWGYILSEEDNLNYYINSTLFDIKLTDTKLNSIVLPNDCSRRIDCMFIDIYTSVGVLQFVAYNEDRGYYGHNSVIISKQLFNCKSL